MQTVGRAEIFIEVAKLESFSKAGRALGMTGPAVSKQIMALEDELGVKLLHRTTRMVSLTDEGALYYERARHAIEELREAAEQLHEMRAAPRGALKLNAPVSFGQAHMLPVLSGFAKKYPEVQLEVTFDDRLIDIMAEGYDMVIRIGTPNDSSLTVRHLGDCPIYVVASPAYLKEHGTPRLPADLKHHRVIGYTNQGVALEWRYRGPGGKTGVVRSEGAFRANNTDMMLQAALDGVGIGILPLFSIDAHMKAGQLVRLMPDYETHPGRRICALMPPNRYRAAKVKLLLEWITQACKVMPLGQA